MSTKLIVGKLYRRNNVPHNQHAIIHARGVGLPETWTWSARSFARYHDRNTISISNIDRIDMAAAIMYLGKETDFDVFLYGDERLVVMYPETVLELIEGEA